MPLGTLFDNWRCTSGKVPLVAITSALVNFSRTPLVSTAWEPALKTTLPPIIPVPPNVAFVCTVTVLVPVPLAFGVFTSNVPPRTSVVPL